MKVRHDLCALLHSTCLPSNWEGIFMSGAAVAQPSSQANGLWYLWIQTAAVLTRPWASSHYVVAWWENIKHPLGSPATQSRSQGDSSSRGWSCPTCQPLLCSLSHVLSLPFLWKPSADSVLHPCTVLSCLLLAPALLAGMMDDLEGRCSPPAFHFIAPCVPQAADACEILQSQGRAHLAFLFSSCLSNVMWTHEL